MKVYLRWVCMLLFLLMGRRADAQQNLHATQYIFNSLGVNPAYAGYKEDTFAQVSLRSQWTGMEGAPRTGMLSIDGLINPDTKRHAVGFHIASDALGAQSATSIYANYALRLPIDDFGEHHLALGIAGGVSQYSLDGNKFRPTDPGDPILPPGMISTWNPDIRLGMYYANPNWYVGFSAQDLFANSDSNSDYRFNENNLESLYRNVNLYLMGGALFPVSEGLQLRPSVLVKDDLKGPTTVDVNAMFIFDTRFWVGGGYRTRSRIFNRTYFDFSEAKLHQHRSLQLVSQIHMTSRLRLGYSYDFMINDMSTYQGGVHEITLGFSLTDLRSPFAVPRLF